ncbi:MAG: hypothetical protein KGM99_15020 [Burkholderiales bacterium]|nr:hypothetical protein [Burkholderiales bacterium]
MELSDDAVNVMLTAAKLPIAASQLRQLDPNFGIEQSHAQQMRFLNTCFVEADSLAIADDELILFSLRRWQAGEIRSVSTDPSR